MKILRTRIDPTNYAAASELAVLWGRASESRYVCAANVHMLMEAHDAADFREMVNGADLVTPDGVPLVWLMRLKGQRAQERVYGPDLMLRVVEAAASAGLPVGFYGALPGTLERLIERMQARCPELNVAYSFSPPYRDLSVQEDEQVRRQIRASGARILFVGLGCPKQERWMAAQRGKIPAVMLGVGAAFDFHAGDRLQAPGWLQKAGLEWLFRLLVEPRRLWRRYLYNNPRFIFLAVADLLGLVR